ncbi:DUF1599 domain-containing protein [Weeksellaceae bacterium TAE3-ERU29]|nr:DUF1599 domain-containing protein [Weeksellaceae bacterium TAE3-ERU29]
MEKTLQQYNKVINTCRSLFEKKLKDYGASWRILRLPSVTDQIFIKANRIRNIQDAAEQKIEEGQESEFIAIVNYSVIALIQLEKGLAVQVDISEDEILNLYDKYIKIARDLMEKKNHDYGESWRDMRVSSITDLILQKILRVKQIEDNQGKTIVSEGLDANYLDMLNYAVFSLIKLSEK